MNTNCIVCSSDNIEPIYSANNYPYFTAPLEYADKIAIEKEYSINDLSDDLNYVFCKVCGHVYTDKFPNTSILNKLYEHYYTYPSSLEKGIEPIRDNAFLEYFKDIILEFLLPRGESKVLEIGCFDGYILSGLKDMGFDVTGCDPSNGADIGKLHGINIHKEFFNTNFANKFKNKFKVVITRHLIEHLEEPHIFVNNISRVLENEGLLVIETPNITNFTQTGSVEVFSQQHISLFSPDSIRHLLQINNFDVISIEHDSENIYCLAKKSLLSKITSNDESFLPNSISTYKYNTFKDNLDKNIQIMDKFVSNHTKICIWGAGSFAISVIKSYKLPVNKIIYFVDSDKSKWGKQYLDYSLDINGPSTIKSNPPTLIVIASMYSETIYNSILNKYDNIPIVSINKNITITSTTEKYL
jgi:2-polyprenyl-3-methyl-5-hydroxy-6-metoxy-1,4-benzoquinol methylase